ncbi:unnamed protein product [Periconia digitata]|uniref:Uncharacterized protein n=1 Tax=Periconia digitata TaxID=1303443 RepID=A0A9W4UFH6_9PLEO|nr:unnamed protein product [Periconia digitata]
MCKTCSQNYELHHGDEFKPRTGNVPKQTIEVSSATLPVKLVTGSDISSSDKIYTTLSHYCGCRLPSEYTTLAGLQPRSQRIFH